MPTHKLPEVAADLADRMCGLDQSAFEEFANAFLPYLEAFFHKGGASVVEAEDLALMGVSEVCLKIGRYRKIPGIAFPNWVMSIARHKRADWQRKQFEMPQPVPYDDLIEAVTFAGDDSPADENVRWAVRDAINRLSRLQRSILEIIDKGFAEKGSERKSPEIGKILGVPASTVRSEHRRAKLRLKATLERDPRMSERLRRSRQREAVLS